MPDRRRLKLYGRRLKKVTPVPSVALLSTELWCNVDIVGMVITVIVVVQLPRLVTGTATDVHPS